MFGSGQFLRRLRRDTKGNTLVIAAAALIPLTALIGSALDLGVAYMTRSRLQNACDAGALAARQFMQGSDFNQNVETEGKKFFKFNFPDGTAGVATPVFELVQDNNSSSQLIGTASASVPTSIMRIFGFTTIPLKVDCNATRDMGHNDIVLVLDVTGSMNDAPTGGGSSKISRLRTGAKGLFHALDNDDGSVTRYGIVPYSHTVNVGRSLMNKDILDEQPYVERVKVCSGWSCYYTTQLKTVKANESSWNIGKGGGSTGGNREKFRTSGDGCIEERPSVGEAFSLTGPFKINDTITQDDVDTRAGNAGNQPELQFGRYDPPVQEGESQDGCPSEATTLQEYNAEAAFQTAIDKATARVTGGTYHDVGMLWGLRFISRTGFFADDNPTDRDGIPVNQHIVFMTDGKLDTGDLLYSAFGVQRYEQRVQGCSYGSNGCNAAHVARFKAACDLAKAKGITVWAILLDTPDDNTVKSCATSPDHFYVSDGSDLEQVFEKIGQGIGNLRLTR